jgi:hypothetical protein
MTPSTKPVTRLTDVVVRDRGLRPLVATLHGSLLIMRAKGCRRTEVLDIGAAYSLAIKQRVAFERAQKRKGKS